MPRRADLYSFNLDVSGDEIDLCRKELNAEERARADRFAAADIANRWQAARAGLRRILASYLDAAPDKLQFTAGRNGKPRLAGSAADQGLYFNLSHSGDVAIVAVTRIGEIGVDVELLRPIRDWAGVAARFFSAVEQAQLTRVEQAQRMEAFYTCWTRKEAVIKCTGEGLSAKLDRFDVSLVPGAPPHVLDDRNQYRDELTWHLHHFIPAADYVAAAAVRAAGTVSWHEHSFRLPDTA